MLDHKVETFLALCQTMNYTRAAEQLHITQRTVKYHASENYRKLDAKNLVEQKIQNAKQAAINAIEESQE